MLCHLLYCKFILGNVNYCSLAVQLMKVLTKTSFIKFFNFLDFYRMYMFSFARSCPSSLFTTVLNSLLEVWTVNPFGSFWRRSISVGLEHFNLLYYLYIFIIWRRVFYWELNHSQIPYATSSGTRVAYFPYVTFASVVLFNDVTIPAFCFC